MNEMYNMSIVTHFYGVVWILVGIVINLMILKVASNIAIYKRQMRIFTPIHSIGIGMVIFTGVVMMAAKHLNFSIENIVMIIFALAIIILEAKRAKTLKYLNPKVENGLENFKPLATNILLFEIFITLLISTWMVISVTT